MTDFSNQVIFKNLLLILFYSVAFLQHYKTVIFYYVHYGPGYYGPGYYGLDQNGLFLEE